MDYFLADALVAKLDELQWVISSPTLVVPPRDPLEEMSRTRRNWHTDILHYPDDNGERFY